MTRFQRAQFVRFLLGWPRLHRSTSRGEYIARGIIRDLRQQTTS